MQCCSNSLCKLVDYKNGPPKLQKCSNCMKETYCSRECQVVDWKFHKVICKLSTTTNPEALKLRKDVMGTDYGAKRQKDFDMWNKYNSQLIQAIEIHSLENKFKDHVCCMYLGYDPDSTVSKIKIVEVVASPILSTKFSSELQQSFDHIVSATNLENHHYSTICQFVNTPVGVGPITIINPAFVSESLIRTIKNCFPTLESALTLVNQNAGEDMYRKYKESHRK